MTPPDMTDSAALPPLPALPEPAHRGLDGTGNYFSTYTCPQMRAYAREALRAQAASVVPVAEVAAKWPAGAGPVEAMRHNANEWADAAINALQGLKNVRDGIANVSAVIANVEETFVHCHEVSSVAMAEVMRTTPAHIPADVSARRRQACLDYAAKHPVVLEIMANCAHAIDTESSAMCEPGEWDSEPWWALAKQLEAEASAIRAEDPEIWQVLADTHAPQAPQAVGDDDIRRIFLANGFTVKDGQTDLKPYVFQAARALIALAIKGSK